MKVHQGGHFASSIVVQSHDKKGDWVEEATMTGMKKNSWHTVKLADDDETGNDDGEFEEPTGWAIVASTTKYGWSWDVDRLKFMSETGEVTPTAYGCKLIHSGSAGASKSWGRYYKPENAWVDTRWRRWGGRKGSNGLFYIGFQGC